MKKILSLVSLMLLALAASAQNYTYQSFLTVRSLGIGTNGGTFLTNLSALVTNAGMVHNTNIFWTNNAGVIVRSGGSLLGTNIVSGVTGGTNSVSANLLFKDVRLYTDREGRLPIAVGNFLGTPTTNLTNNTIGLLTLHIALSSPWGTNMAVGFNIAPVWDGSPQTIGAASSFQGHPTTPTSTADDFSVVVPAGSGYTTLSTNIPIWKWPGAYALRIRTITNNLNIGGETAVTNTTFIHRLGVSSYIP